MMYDRKQVELFEFKRLLLFGGLINGNSFPWKAVHWWTSGLELRDLL